MATFAERLISVPQCEKGGETGYERYDYQLEIESFAA
jgi:hypothetical protein